MGAPLRLVGFAAVLAAVFGLSVVGARILLPADLARGASTSPSHDTTTQTGEGSHGGEHDPTPAAAPVRGLAIAQDGYQLDVLTAPEQTGQDGSLSFRLTGPDGRPVTDYTTAHDKDLHLIVVRSDGSRFRHVHPSHDGNGGWSLPWRWAAAGSYRVFADFVPTATGQPLTLTSTVDVGGALTPVMPGKDTDTDIRTAVADGFTVTAKGTLRAGQESMLTFTVTRDGKPVTELQPYLGAAGHLVALRSGDLAYLHVHPLGENPNPTSGPDIGFMTTTPSPGRYLLYLDFQVDGQVHTAAFTATSNR